MSEYDKFGLTKNDKRYIGVFITSIIVAGAIGGEEAASAMLHVFIVINIIASIVFIIGSNINMNKAINAWKRNRDGHRG